ncbi:hypothetical protein BC834DRAFT_1043735 [Gloeopeniophorella convolvens]|nr:hypothetical protein BC834DRAFT_1043735 [Gloeopeniophorella convolvens]
MINDLITRAHQLLLMVNRPALKLETLSIASIDLITLPHTFTLQGNVRLRKLELLDIIGPLPLTPPASVTDFSLSLNYLEGSTHVDWLEDLGSKLRAMPQLEYLKIDLVLDLPLDVPFTTGGASISLPRLSKFSFSGLCHHLEELIAAFDVPVLSDLDIDLFDQSSPIAIPQLARYIQASPKFHASAAHVGITSDTAYIKTYSGGGNIRLRLFNHSGTIFGEDVGIMKPTLIAINSALEPVFSSVRTLVLGFENDEVFSKTDVRPSSAFGCYWNEALEGFKSVTTLRVDNVVARAAHLTPALENWVQLVPNLREVVLYSSIDDKEVETFSILRSYEQFLRDRLPDSDVTLQCRIHTLNGSTSWSNRHDDLIHGFE